MSRDTVGQASALTVLTAIKAGEELPLATYLNGFGQRGASPLAAVPGTHFARWVVLGDVVFQGKGRRDHLNCAQLLFTSNFDGATEQYLEGLRTGLGESADLIWSHCHGYPGAADARAFAQFLSSHRVRSSLFFTPYGERTVAAVRDDLDRRRQFIDFALEAQWMPVAQRASSFRERFHR